MNQNSSTTTVKYQADELQFPQWLMDHHTWWPYLNGALQLAAVAGAIVPAVLAHYVYDSGLHSLELILVVIGFAAAAPFFVLAWYWHPCPVHTVSSSKTTSVDICVTMFKEDLHVIRGTLQACQQIQAGHHTVHIFALDDGNRPEVAQICDELNNTASTAAGGATLMLHYFARDTNRGRKGGNLNDWLEQHARSEFFIVLDADMQPFPDMIETFLGHYHGFAPDVRDTIAYIQTPQHFCNHVPFFDVYDIDMAVLYKTMFVPMDGLGVAMCFGTGTFWRRAAVASCGGFDEVCATEDAVTGCKVHKANNRLECKTNGATQSTTTDSDEICETTTTTTTTTSPKDSDSSKTHMNPKHQHSRRSETQWISKFLKRPVAVGISPRNLPELMDQRLRWAVAAIQATTAHRWFFFGGNGLSWSQKMVYWATSGYWFYGILAFIVQVFGSITIMYFIGISGGLAQEEDVIIVDAPIWTSIIPMVSAIAYVAVLPIASLRDKLASIPMFFSYTPVYVCAALHHWLGVPIPVQHTCAEGDNGPRRWHWMFVWHVMALAGVTCGAIVAGVYCEPTLMNYVTLVIQVGLWIGFYFPVYVSIVFGTQVDHMVHWYGGEQEATPSSVDGV